MFRVADFPIALEISALKKVHDAGALPPRTPGSRVVDLHYIMGARKNRSPGYWIEMEIEAGRYLIPVEEVEGIRELSLAVPISYPRVLVRPETRYIRRLFFDGIRMLTLLDVQGLAELAGGKHPAAPRLAGPEVSPPEAGGAGPNLAATPGPPGRLVVFEVGDRQFALALDKVVQIISHQEIFQVPGATRRMMGVAYYAEQAVPVVDPARLPEMAGEKAQLTEPDFTMIMITESRRGMIGFPGNKVVKVVWQPSGADKPPKSPDPDPWREIKPDEAAINILES